jgi:hypothetical protein
VLIRREQAEELRKLPLQVFEDEMVAHLADFSPPLFNVIKEDQMRVAVRFGIERAGECGFTLRGPIRLYLELMLLFGSHFDNDPQYPWAGEIVHDDSGVEMERAERLHRQTIEYQEKVSGADGVNTRQALGELATLGKNSVAVSAASLVEDIYREMNRVFPQKAKFIGEAGLKTLINEGRAAAEKHNFRSAREQTLMVVLMYAFGHGCSADPLYPWISRTLNDTRIQEPALRAKRLEKKALNWLDHVLVMLDTGVAKS